VVQKGVIYLLFSNKNRYFAKESNNLIC
jgi:hypothetical protein